MSKAPADCATMTDIRAEIDRVDDALFALFEERLGYIRRAAAIKQPQGLPADIPERVDEVIANARRHAEARGLDPALYGAFWEQLVRAAIAEEERIFRGETGE